MTLTISDVIARLDTATPVEIDTALSSLHHDRERAAHTATARMETLHRLTGDRRYRRMKVTVWATSQEDTLAKIDAMIAAAGPDAAAADRAKAAWESAAAAVPPITAKIDTLEAEYRRRGWNRFFLVTSSNGHIHRSRSCSTCNKDGALTEFAWLPNLSGQTETEAVAAHGAILCTVCWPTAPTHWTNAHEIAAAAKKAAQCAGSGTPYDLNLPHRTGYYSGNWATCPHCSGKITVTPTMKLRSHKPA